jgi:hypothetical protein
MKIVPTSVYTIIIRLENIFHITPSEPVCVVYVCVHVFMVYGNKVYPTLL